MSLPCYSFRWASLIVQQYRREHTRATDYVCAVWGLGPENIAYFLAKDPHSWYRFKQMVKYVEKHHNLKEKELPLLSSALDLVNFLHRKFGEKPISLLTKRINRYLLEEQGKEGVSEALRG